MLSDKQLKSLIRMGTASSSDGTNNNQQGDCLDVSHQQLRKLKRLDLDKLNMTRIDASYNYFLDFQSLNLNKSQAPQHLRNVPGHIQWLDLSFNFVTAIDQIGNSSTHLQHLRYLNMSANRIESVNLNFCPFPVLESLHLKNNKLKYFVHCPKSVKVLTLDHNELSSLAFTGGQNLSILSASHNFITKLGVVLENMLFLDVENNQIEQLTNLKQFLQQKNIILSLNLLNNPVSKNKHYKITVLQMCERIVQINDVVISPHIREGFKVLKAEERLDGVIQKTHLQYQMRIKEKIKIKEQLLVKLHDQEKQVEHKFVSNMTEEKNQLELLEMHAKNILGKNKLNILKQGEQFQVAAHKYIGNQRQASQNGYKENQRCKIQSMHMKDYLEYLQKVNRHTQKRDKSRQIEQHVVSKQQKRSSLYQKSVQIQKLVKNSLKHKQSQQVKQQKPKQMIEIDKNIKLFDTKCIEYLFAYYQTIEDQEQY